MTNRAIYTVEWGWDGTTLFARDPSSGLTIARITPAAAGTTTETLTSTSATSAYTGAASSMSVTGLNTGDAVLDAGLPTY